MSSSLVPSWLSPIVRGTGVASLVFYATLCGAALYLLLPEGNQSIAAFLSGAFAAIRVEMNGYRAHIERMEADLAIDDDNR